jgi:hypothetical protein
MKKLILIPIVLLLLVFAGLGTLLPIGFHNFVHQTILPGMVAKGIEVKFTDLGFSQKRTSFELSENKPPLRIEIDSISSFNPKNNYLSIKVTELKNNFPIEFEVHPIVTPAGELKVHFKFIDLEYKNDQMDLKTQDANIYIGDFSLEDLKGFEKDPKALFFNKSITVELKSLMGKINQRDKDIKDLYLNLGTKVADNKLSLHLSTKVGKANVLKQTESINAKDTDFTFRLGDFDFEKTKKIIESLPKQFAGGKKPSMFAMLGYIKAIIFPFELNYDGGTKLGSDDIKFKLDAKVKSKHILNLDTFGLNLSLQHQKMGIIDILTPLIASRYAGDIASHYALKDNQPAEERFLDRGRIKAKLQKILEQAISDKNEELLAAALEIKLIKSAGSLYTTNLALQNKMIDMNGEKFPFKDLKKLPKRMIRKLFPSFNPRAIRVSDSELAGIITREGLFRAVVVPPTPPSK